MNIAAQELRSRWERYQKYLSEYLPQAGGAFVFSRLNIYYFTGTFPNGLLWVPLEGEPVLLCRRGIERARDDSPLSHIVSFGSYRDIPNVLNDLGAALPSTVAVDMNGLSWSLSNSLKKNLPEMEFTANDRLLAMTRSEKSPWELEIMKEGGRRHDRCMTELLPETLHEGMSELEIAHLVSEVYYKEGHLGIVRMETFGEEMYGSHISIGESGNHPTVFNGPNGNRGIHPSVPYMGSEGIRWQQRQPLLIDNCFTYHGYHTDKTQIYFLGKEEDIPAEALKAQEFCMELHDRVKDMLKPGEVPSRIWDWCNEFVADSPWKEGFMGLGKNKVGFLGHGIGLATDEFPVIARRFDQPFKAGMTLAVEPKIGIPGFGMVGIENTMEVTEHGGRSLTSDGTAGIITI